MKYARPDNEGRLSLEVEGNTDSTIGNSNDLSAHIILLMPFLAWWAFRPETQAWKKYPILALIGYGVWVNLGTSSRGALVAMIVMCLFTIMRAGTQKKILLIIAFPAIAAILYAVLPAQNIARLITLFGMSREEGITAEAKESRDSRQYLVEQSIKFTLENPIFGIGPGNFSNYEGMYAQARGEHGNWHETHNTWTEVSSECGVPAFLLFAASLLVSFVMVGSTYSRASRLGNDRVMRICMAYQTAMIGYIVCITFLAAAFRFTFPAMVGFGAAIHHTGNRLMSFEEPPVPSLSPWAKA
jgi:O-antigen ligase